uniref:Uncharacterized protein n=1 Tax=Anguilla anguilla TaxID=7936 RepID=A0A0E9T3L4_ANGAN
MCLINGKYCVSLMFSSFCD